MPTISRSLMGCVQRLLFQHRPPRWRVEQCGLLRQPQRSRWLCRHNGQSCPCRQSSLLLLLLRRPLHHQKSLHRQPSLLHLRSASRVPGRRVEPAPVLSCNARVCRPKQAATLCSKYNVKNLCTWFTAASSQSTALSSFTMVTAGAETAGTLLSATSSARAAAAAATCTCTAGTAGAGAAAAVGAGARAARAAATAHHAAASFLKKNSCRPCSRAPVDILQLADAGEDARQTHSAAYCSARVMLHSKVTCGCSWITACWRTSG